MPTLLLASGVEQILPLAFFLLLFAVLKWFQRPKDTAEDPEDSQPLSRDPQHKLPDESMRKLMEALGLPADALPPPVVVQSAPKPEKQQQESLRFPPPLPTVQVPSIRVEAFRAPKLTARIKKVPEQKAKTATVPPHGLHKPNVLREPALLRQAIVLREILGPPKALE
jgi:hypothetical protein